MHYRDYLLTRSNRSQKFLYLIIFIDKLRYNTFMLQTRNIRIMLSTKYTSIFRQNSKSLLLRIKNKTNFENKF